MTVRGPMVRIALLEDTDRSKTRRRTTFGRARTEFAPFGMRASYDAKHRVDRRSYDAKHRVDRRSYAYYN